MNKKIFEIFIFAFALFCVQPVQADVEALRTVLEQVGSNHPEFEKKVTEAKTLINQTKKLTAQVKENVSQVKGAAEKAKGLVDKAKKTAESIKEGKILGSTSLSEFKSLSFVSSGDVSMTDSEKADATADLFLKKPEKDDISYEREKETAINQRNGNQSADQYSESLVLRQTLAAEKDDPKTPETVTEAQSLIQTIAQKSFERNNQVTRMKAIQLDYLSSNALNELNGTEKKNDE